MRTSRCVKRLVCMGIAALATLAATASAAGPAAGQWTVLTAPDNSFNIWVLQGDQSVMSISPGGWGPGWSWKPGLSSREKASGGLLQMTSQFVVDKEKGQVIDVACQAQKTGENEVTFKYALNAAVDVPLTMLMDSITMAGPFNKGQIVVTLADGTTKTIKLPVARTAVLPAVSKLAFQPEGAGEIDVTLDPACQVQPENNNPRIMLASDVFPQGTRVVAVTLSFPGPVRFAASAQDQAGHVKEMAGPDWFEFQPANDNGPSVISMNGWLDRPAGVHGGVRMVGDEFQFEDGTPVKFWGTNLSYTGGAPAKNDADLTAARFAKYGINGVRLHKFAGPSGWEGIADKNDATKFEPAGLDRLDYFCSRLTENGVYYGFSHTFGFRPGPANRGSLLAYDEIEKNLGGNTYGLINLAPDVQNLMIQRVVNLLSHRNPYTNRTYAEDPALNYIELQNEDDIFFYSTESVLQKCPTYARAVTAAFTAWLKTKYGTRDALAKAWPGALKQDETFEAGNIAVQGNPWYMADGLPKSGGQRQRMLDNAAFFHAVQDDYYSRFVRAIRAAGYKGPLCGSPWQAPAMVPHYYNLVSDYEVGYIDRHNYAGGGNNLLYSMLTRPGTGCLSSGLQQVADRPFGLSEWITVYPSFYSADGVAIIAVYGMGLQGWDSSYEFQSFSNRKGYNTIAGQQPYGVWEVDEPTQIGQYPALARMVLRGDVKEGPVISTRRVSPQELAEGKFSFTDKVAQSGDIKEFGGSVPPQALAAGRDVVEFTSSPQPTEFADMAKYTSGDTITSATGQLTWDTSGKGFITVSTDGTKAVVGFAEGQTAKLGDVDITLQCPYASVFLTALDRDATLATDRHALVSVVARESNSGFSYFSADGHILSNGKAPILLEPVKARIHVGGRDVAGVRVLDQDGRATMRTVEVKDGAFTIDTARDHTLYYEVVFR